MNDEKNLRQSKGRGKKGSQNSVNLKILIFKKKSVS